jgi:hypothetical protein
MMKSWTRVWGLICLACAVTAPGLRGQETGRVEGTVFDSTAMAPLGGARVALIGTSFVTDSNDDGTFDLEEVPAGSYPVTFFHPRLQELGISASGGRVEVAEGGAARINLAVPSSGTILRAWCAAEAPGSGYAPVAGFVRDSLTNVSLPGASVTISVLESSGRIERTISDRTDDEGYYRLCGVPAGRTVRLVATFGSSGSAPTVRQTSPGGSSFEDLVLTLSSIGEIQGQVIDYATKEPLTGARVTILGTDSEILTDDEGEFVLDELPPGLHLVETEYLGYATRTDSVTIRSDEAVLVEVPLAASAIEIAGMTVTARGQRGDILTDVGRRTDFMSREQVDAVLPRTQNAAQLLQGANFPGLSVRDVTIQDGLAQIQGVCVEHNRARNRSGGGCQMITVFLDGLRLPDPGIFLAELNPQTVETIQLFGPTEAMMRYGNFGVNGVLLITTRRR